MVKFADYEFLSALNLSGIIGLFKYEMEDHQEAYRCIFFSLIQIYYIVAWLYIQKNRRFIYPLYKHNMFNIKHDKGHGK